MRRKVPRLKYFTVIGLITLIIIGFGWFMWCGGLSLFADEPFSMVEGGWARGVGDAPITIDVFLNFGCGQCIEKERTLMEVLSLYPLSVRMVYHHYAFSSHALKMAEALVDMARRRERRDSRRKVPVAVWGRDAH